MRSISRISILFALALALLSIMSTYAALDTSILVVEQRNMSVNLSLDFAISKIATVQNQQGAFGQGISINNTKEPLAGNATLIFLNFYTDGVFDQMDPIEFSKLMEDTFVGAFKLGGGKEVGKLTLKNSIGQNVTVHKISTQKSKAKPTGEKMDFAFWNLDKRNYVMLTSTLDQNVTTMIVETLRFRL